MAAKWTTLERFQERNTMTSTLETTLGGKPLALKKRYGKLRQPAGEWMPSLAELL